ncbi:MAG: menaquinone biosynthesis protein [Planctomycetota bacterium]|nr:menaquinone biosynthesis protein [Planctomycetota bacterium]
MTEPVNSPYEAGEMCDRAQMPASAVRIGAVSYLNSKPLIEDLSNLLPEASVSLDYPSRLADQLAAGDLDVALIPSIEYMLRSDYEIISDACVATRGPVLSVKLYSRVDPGAIRTLALDEGSRTSAALARVMLLDRYGVEPDRQPLPIEMSVQHTNADAVLLIGDRAMHAPAEEFHTVWDLGAEWTTWTGLPFVFAMWVARRGVATTHVEQMLSESRNRGVASIPEIARREAATLNISVESAERYLIDNLYFRLTSAERNGLRLFQQLSVQAGLAPEGVDLVFRN